MDKLAAANAVVEIRATFDALASENASLKAERVKTASANERRLLAEEIVIQMEAKGLHTIGSAKAMREKVAELLDSGRDLQKVSEAVDMYRRDESLFELGGSRVERSAEQDLTDFLSQ